MTVVGLNCAVTVPVQHECTAPLTPAEVTTLMAGTPTWDYNFEGGWDAEYGVGGLGGRTVGAKKWRYAQMQTDAAGTTVDDPLRPGNTVMRFFWQKGAGQQYDSNTQKKAQLYGNFATSPRPEEIWTFEVGFPSDGMSSDSHAEIVAQWHDHPDTNDGPRIPPLSLENKAGRLNINWRYDQHATTPPVTNWDPVQTTIDLGPTPLDQWITFVLHIKWDPFGCGAIRVWQNTVLVVDQGRVPIGYDDALGPYAGFGIYKYTGDSNFNYRTIYFDNIKQWVAP